MVTNFGNNKLEVLYPKNENNLKNGIFFFVAVYFKFIIFQNLKIIHDAKS